MGITATPYIPMVQLDFHTPNALYSAHGAMQPTDDLVSVQTNKTIKDPAGTWEANFVYRRGSDGKTWFDRINPMDVVVIKMGRQSYPWITPGNGSTDVVMVGLVDEVHVVRTMGADGSPQRRVNIIGRDFAKMMVEADLQFYPSLQGQTQDNFLLTQDGWVALMAYFIGNAIENGTPAQMIGQVMSKILPKLMNFNVPFWDMYRGQVQITSKDILRYRLGKSQFMQPFMMTLANYEGTLWNLMEQVSESPFNELFLDVMTMPDYKAMLADAEIESDISNDVTSGYSPIWGNNGEKVVLLLRPTPFDQQLWDKLPTRHFRDAELENIDYAKSDSEAYSLFFAGESLSIPTTTDIKAVAPPVFDEAKAKKYGIKPMEVQIQGISTKDGQDQQAILASKSLSQQLYNWYKDNDVYRSGTMNIRGRGDVHIGQRGIYIPDDPQDESLEFYIEGVQQSYTYYSEADVGSFNTALTFTRGRAPGTLTYATPTIQQQPPSPTPPPKATTSYKVKDGDTLWGIASRLYNDPEGWTTIWNANKDMLIARDKRNDWQPGHWIYAGQVLKIPPK